jgi:hypothetical protein
MAGLFAYPRQVSLFKMKTGATALEASRPFLYPVTFLTLAANGGKASCVMNHLRHLRFNQPEAVRFMK